MELDLKQRIRALDEPFRFHFGILEMRAPQPRYMLAAPLSESILGVVAVRPTIDNEANSAK